MERGFYVFCWVLVSVFMVGFLYVARAYKVPVSTLTYPAKFSVGSQVHIAGFPATVIALHCGENFSGRCLYDLRVVELGRLTRVDRAREFEIYP